MNLFKKTIIVCVAGISALILPNTASSNTAPATGVDECAKELLLSYFPEPIVTETLKRFSIPQDKMTAITKSLSNKDKDVVKLVEEKASGMNPNPLKDPQQRQAAVKLFRETLLQVFTDALKENGINDTSNFQAMLDDIQQQKAKKFAMCMEKHKNTVQNSNQKSSSNNNSDNDDDEDEGDNDDSDEDDDSEDDEDDKSKMNSKTNQQPAAK